jgi:3-hydroxyisobutyrate dehydrogenase
MVKILPSNPLSSKELESDNLSLNQVERNCWDLHKLGCLKGKEPFHTFVLATRSEMGVDLRTVVLRKVNEEERLIYFHTDIRASKVEQLGFTDDTAILFYDPNRRIQIRIKAKAAFHTDDAIADSIWTETRLSARKYYLSQKPPGAVLNNCYDSLPQHLHGFDPEKEESENGRANFLVVSLKISQMDWLFLCSQGHKRAMIDYVEGDYKASWINP